MIEIIVKEAKDLQIQGNPQSMTSKMMTPFFTYRFYTFGDETSPVLQSKNPKFQMRKQYEVENNTEFVNYMRKNILRIEFIDDSIDMT